MYGMIATMDKAGRIVIPKAIRTEAGLTAGAPLEVRVRAGRVEIEPVPRRVALERHGPFLVAEAVDEGAALTADEVRRAVADVRRGGHGDDG